jgi:hypothetical protein
MSIEVELLNGHTARFRDPDRPGAVSNRGDSVDDVVRFSYRIGEDKSLAIVKETITAVHGIDDTWVDVQVKHEHPEVAAYYPPGQWTNVREVD